MLTQEGANISLGARNTENVKGIVRADINQGPPHDEGGRGARCNVRRGQKDDVVAG
jgi:hypothetical protein